MAYKNNWTFVNCELSDKDKAALESYADEHQREPMSVIEELTASGYKISLSWLDDNHCFIVTISGTKYTSFNEGSSMSSRSDDLSEAFFMAGFKHFILAGGKDWSKLDTERSGWG